MVAIFWRLIIALRFLKVGLLGDNFFITFTFFHGQL